MTTERHHRLPSSLAQLPVRHPAIEAASGTESVILRERLQREYEEMPGMSLNVHQARRLFAISEDVCRLVFDELVARGVLRRLRDGRYVLNTPAA
jgi:hypothetical protein